MKIEVKKDIKAACEKGISTKEYKAGNVYDIYDNLAQVFLKEGWGVSIDAKPVEEKEKVEEKKDLEPTTVVKRKSVRQGRIKNKSLKSSPENKKTK